MRFEYFKITERIAMAHDRALMLGNPIKCVYLTKKEMDEFDKLTEHIGISGMWDGILIKPEEGPLPLVENEHTDKAEKGWRCHTHHLSPEGCPECTDFYRK